MTESETVRTARTETHAFEAEVGRLLDIVANALYSDREVFLRELLRRTEDDEARARLQIALDEIEIEYKARLLDRARELYRERTGHDIRSVDDLVRPPDRVLARLPSPEPDGIPPSLSRGSVWQIDPDDGRIESSYLGSRYEVHYSDGDRKRLKVGREAGRAGESNQEAGSIDG